MIEAGQKPVQCVEHIAPINSDERGRLDRHEHARKCQRRSGPSTTPASAGEEESRTYGRLSVLPLLLQLGPDLKQMGVVFLSLSTVSPIAVLSM